MDFLRNGRQSAADTRDFTVYRYYPLRSVSCRIDTWQIVYLSYRAKRTAGHLRVSHVNCNVMHTSALVYTKPCAMRFDFRSCVLYIQSSVADKFKVVGCHGHNLNTDHKRRHFKFRKGIEVVKLRIWSDLLSAAYQNGDQHYDVGPLCLIIHKSEIWNALPVSVTCKDSLLSFKAALKTHLCALAYT